MQASTPTRTKLRALIAVVMAFAVAAAIAPVASASVPDWYMSKQRAQLRGRMAGKERYGGLARAALQLIRSAAPGGRAREALRGRRRLRAGEAATAPAGR